MLKKTPVVTDDREVESTSTCVKSFGLVESRLDAAFTMGLDARWQYMAIYIYNWKSVGSTTLFGCCVYMRFGCRQSMFRGLIFTIVLTLRSDWGLVTKTLQTST